MRKIRRFFRRFLLLSKRLLRRPAYLGVLLLVPLFALALSLFAGQESGVLHVALVREEPADPAAAAAVERLLTERSVLRFTEFADETEAREALRHGQVDAAWIFSDGFSRELERFGGRGHADAVTVLEREDNVFLMLSREKLFAAIYPETSREIFLDYLKTELGAESLTRDEAARWYDSLTTTERVVRFETLEGGEAETDGSYLTAPLRGLMALLLVLCGMASGLYSYREEREGSFVWLPSRARRLVPLLDAASIPCRVRARPPDGDPAPGAGRDGCPGSGRAHGRAVARAADPAALSAGHGALLRAAALPLPARGALRGADPGAGRGDAGVLPGLSGSGPPALADAAAAAHLGAARRVGRLRPLGSLGLHARAGRADGAGRPPAAGISA